MKINHLKINSFGKLKQKDIDFNENINLIYGKNEAGKSTLINFILNILYGISKNKKGKEISDYEKYLPWFGEDFSGLIDYELNNGEKFKVYRDFNKKNPEIFNERMEDISKEFNIDKTSGNEFFYEQTRVDEDLFLSTLLVGQQEVKLENKNQNMLIQRIANIMGTGEDNVFYKKAMDRINKRQLEEIGSERTKGKPINVIEEKINDLINKKRELSKYKEYKYDIEEKKNYQVKLIKDLEFQKELLKEIKLLFENQKIEEEKLKLKKELNDKNERRINELDLQINRINDNELFKAEKNLMKVQRKYNDDVKSTKKMNIIWFTIILILNIVQFIFIHNPFVNMGISISIPLFLILVNKKKKKARKRYEYDEKIENDKIQSIKNQIENIDIQIDGLTKERNDFCKEINDLKNSLKDDKEKGKELIKNKYINKIDDTIINEFINLKNINDINLEIQNLESALSEEKILLHKLEIDKEDIEPKMDSLANIEENLEINRNIKSDLEKKLHSINLAKGEIEKAYQLMKDNVTPKFTNELSKNISLITNNKYFSVMLSDKKGLLVETENGKFVEVSRLSVGTIDQLYLSLRLAMIEEISDESMPIILDESFAYYDNDRLKNVLNFISNKFNKHQVIIFTCANREEKLLNEIGIDYTKISL